ncbi:hypothetical protein PanWU01x14_109570 [Parasponia andersonii]|uniref:Uncharacterized protein n=1 Tax=Parasponia andersonii TaxID=3476 RepID=A0A2P5CZX7_PARAD|nr:hypothetical protein PanWU01x14_109570 [Parasponia andersonii]
MSSRSSTVLGGKLGRCFTAIALLHVMKIRSSLPASVQTTINSRSRRIGESMEATTNLLLEHSILIKPALDTKGPTIVMSNLGVTMMMAEKKLKRIVAFRKLHRCSQEQYLRAIQFSHWPYLHPPYLKELEVVKGFNLVVSHDNIVAFIYGSRRQVRMMFHSHCIATGNENKILAINICPDNHKLSFKEVRKVHYGEKL